MAEEDVFPLVPASAERCSHYGYGALCDRYGALCHKLCVGLTCQ